VTRKANDWFRREEIDRSTLRCRAMDQGGRALSFGDVFGAWRGSEPFRAAWASHLRNLQFGAYCWECPPVSSATLEAPFECVFVASPLLAQYPPDPSPFAEFFTPGCSVATFANLGKDALLVAPCPGAAGSNFAHLATFSATAAPVQQSALWQAVAAAMEERIGTSPTWLSTAGLGVFWLHVRLDSRPKYYRHAPYARMAA
jgi:hypothetical protein